ncbi:MAG TPA: hypothetical protein VG321_07570 [Solirubrobacteraceae bacterium]|nr:hypothetical protein [Solirubrobacteraceae bacterium]
MELPENPALELARAEEREVPKEFSGRPAPSLHRIERRPLGVTPLPFLAGLTVAAFVLAVVLWAAVGWIPGVGLLAVATALSGLFSSGLRRQPDSSTSQLMAGVLVRLRDLTAFLASSGRTWGRTGAEVMSLRWRRVRLERELRHRLKPLGEAVHHGDADRTDALKGETAALQRRLDELGSHEAELVSSAQSEIERERAPVQPTEVFTPVSSAAGSRSEES